MDFLDVMINMSGPKVISEEDTNVLVVCPCPYHQPDHVESKGWVEQFFLQLVPSFMCIIQVIFGNANHDCQQTSANVLFVCCLDQS